MTKAKISLGTVKLGVPDYGFSSQESFSESESVFLDQCWKLGICDLDTSPRYGDSESVIGRYISESNNRFTVSTKVDCLKVGDLESPQKIITSVRKSLKNLWLNQLDICYLHQNDLNIISDSAIQDGLQAIKEQELCSRIGVSVYSLEECEYALTCGIYDVIQVPVSVFDLSFYDRYIKGYTGPVKFVARSIFLQGILQNREQIKARIKQSNEVMRYLEKLDQLAAEANLKTAEMAMGFTQNLNGLEQLILGTTNIDHLRENKASGQRAVPQEIHEQIYQMGLQKKNWSNPRNWA